jgi:hypothetical protein
MASPTKAEAKFGIALVIEVAQAYALAERVPTDNLVIALSEATRTTSAYILRIFEDEWTGNPRNEFNPYRATQKR